MFKKILIPVDLSDRHRRALDLALALPRTNDGELILLHVIEIIPGLPFEEEKAFYGRLEKKAQHHLKQLGSQLESGNSAWRTELRFGNRGAEIVKFASENGVSLIVLTAPQIDLRRPEAGWGSLSFKVSVLAPCPVLLVK